MKKTLVLLLVINATFAFGQSEIFPSGKPIIVPVWNRIADHSPVLRSVETCEFSPDGKFIATGSKFGYAVMLWRVADGALIWESRHESEVECAAFSPDGSKLATGGEDFFVRVWDVATGAQLAAWEHENGLDGITWSHNGRWIASGSEGGDAYIWDAETYVLESKVGCGSTINSLVFSGDDSQLYVAGNIQTPDPETGRKIYTGFSCQIDVNSGSIVRNFGEVGGSVKSIRLSPDEKLMAIGGFEGKVRLYDVASGEQVREFPENVKIEAVAFTPDNHYLVSGGHNPWVSFYSLETFELVHREPCPRVEYVDFSGDGRLMATGHEDSGLLSLFLFVSDTHSDPSLYDRLSREQLDNRDLR